MSADRATNATRWTSILGGCGAIVIGIVLLAGSVAGSDATASGGVADDSSGVAATCAADGDIYRLSEPGSYSALASTPSGAAVVEVRRLDGEVLATSPSTVASSAIVDLLTGAKFGIAPPPVFDVESSVLIHVRHDGSPYELVIVRLEPGPVWSGLDVHPPVEAVIIDSDSCLVGDHRETLRIRTDAVYSDKFARQVFRVTSLGFKPAELTPAEMMLPPAEMVFTPVMGL